MKRFISIGEAMVELAPHSDGHYRQGFAGDTMNTAWYLRQLAPDLDKVGYLSAVGDDPFSDRLRDFVSKAGIEPHLTTIPGATVGLYMISLENGERSFAYWRSASAARQLARDLSALDALKADDMAYFSGITVAILSPEDRETLLATLNRLRERGVRVAFDTNLRPRLWSDDAEMRDWIMRAAGVADIALPSYDDEAVHFGDADAAATAARYAEAGVGLVVVKGGPADVLILQDGQESRVTPDPVAEIVDTTAAGDSFNAGVFSALSRGAEPSEAARIGCQVSGRVIGARGALVEI